MSALREFVLIVAGVVAALAAQAWWEATRDQAKEQEHLRQLLADTRENEARLDRVFARDSLGRETMVRYFAFLLSRGPLPPVDSLVRWRALEYVHFEPLTGTYSTLLQTGDINLLRNNRLRAAVIAHAAAFEAANQSIMIQRQQHWNGLSLKNERELFALPPQSDSRSVAEMLSNIPHHLDYAALRRDPIYRSAVGRIISVRGNRLNTLGGLREPTRQLLEMLETELEIESAQESDTHRAVGQKRDSRE